MINLVLLRISKSCSGWIRTDLKKKIRGSGLSFGFSMKVL